MDKLIKKRQSIDLLHDIAHRLGDVDMYLTAGNIDEAKKLLALNVKDYDILYKRATKHTRKGDR